MGRKSKISIDAISLVRIRGDKIQIKKKGEHKKKAEKGGILSPRRKK